LSDGLIFRISSTHDVLEPHKTLQPPTTISNNGWSKDPVVTFPSYHIAALLFQSFESNVGHLCPILHIPSIRSLIKSIYFCAHQGESILPGQAALLLSIFAIAAYFYQPFESSEVATAKETAIELSKSLTKGALDVLDYSRRNTSGTLEDVQAYIIMSLMMYHLDGFSARGRLLSTSAISIARELRLHQLDDGNDLPVAHSKNNARALIDREIKRRVFWYIASTDWYVVVCTRSFLNACLYICQVVIYHIRTSRRNILHPPQAHQGQFTERLLR
jgi:hypothetical protein